MKIKPNLTIEEGKGRRARRAGKGVRPNGETVPRKTRPGEKVVLPAFGRFARRQAFFFYFWGKESEKSRTIDDVCDQCGV